MSDEWGFIEEWEAQNDELESHEQKVKRELRQKRVAHDALLFQRVALQLVDYKADFEKTKEKLMQPIILTNFYDMREKLEHLPSEYLNQVRHIDSLLGDVGRAKAKAVAAIDNLLSNMPEKGDSDEL